MNEPGAPPRSQAQRLSFRNGAFIDDNYIDVALKTARALRAGTGWINNYDESDITVPFGGYKQSGFGRDKSLHAVEKYTHLKTPWIKTW